ncbi:hypothetical protein AOLI_G00126740 [Acnodon oligacanthus]
MVKIVNLGGSITLPCKLLEVPPVEQLDVCWMLGEHLVIRLNRDQIIYGISYRNRTKLPAGGASRGDFSLTITHTQHGNSGVYRCVMFREEQELKLAELQLSVEVPHSPSTLFVRTDRILQDDISLELKNTQHEDQGVYNCSFVSSKAFRNSAQINLTVTDNMIWLEAGFGSSVLLPLHTVSPVILSFLPDRGNGSVRVCEVEKEQMECGAAYSHRTDLQQDSLELRMLSMEDSGTFSVMERETQCTVSVLFIQVVPPSTGPPEENECGRKITNSVIAVVIVVVIAVIMLRWWRQRQFTEEQSAEIHEPL